MRVFFGMSKGMSCSGGGPPDRVDASKDAFRGSIFTRKPPDRVTTQSVLSSRP